MADNQVKFRVDGVHYTLDQDEITPRLERELWLAIGITPQSALSSMSQGAFFGVCAMTWLARRQRGDKITYQAIEDDLHKARKLAGDDFDLELIIEDGPVEEDDAPQL